MTLEHMSNFLSEAWGVLLVVGGVIASLLYASMYKPKPDLDLTDSFVPLEPHNPLIEPPVDTNKPTDNSTYLYLKAKSFLGIDLTPADEVPDYVACVSQFQALYKSCFGEHLGTGACLYSTLALKNFLVKWSGAKSVSFEDALPGDICIFATGEGYTGSRGHVFVVGKVNWMSNTSATGKWEANYEKPEVVDYFIKKLGFKPHVFRIN